MTLMVIWSMLHTELARGSQSTWNVCCVEITLYMVVYMILFYFSGWLSPGDDSLGYVAQIDNRIEAISGLTMSTAEQLQVVNYGIGGHYEPHYDFSRVS